LTFVSDTRGFRMVEIPVETEIIFEEVFNGLLYLASSDPELERLCKVLVRDLPKIENGWVILPVDGTDERLDLLTVFKNDRAFRHFLELGHSCLGGELISGVTLRETSANHRDAVVSKSHAIGYRKYCEFYLPLLDGVAVKRLERLVTILNHLYASRENASSSSGDDLSAFRKALRLGEFGQAREALVRVKSTGLLSVVNFCFLELQLLSSENNHNTVWNDVRIEDVVRSNRPRVVTEFLLRSLWIFIRDQLEAGHLHEISSVYVTYMTSLLRSIVLPETPEGRICLAIINGLSSRPNFKVFDGHNLEESELQILDFIISQKQIPGHLFKSQSVVNIGGTEIEPKFSSANIQELAEYFREVGDARSIVTAIDWAIEFGVHVELVLKKFIRLVADEQIADFAKIGIEYVNICGVDTTNWSRGMRTALESVEALAKLMDDGWNGLTKLTKAQIGRMDQVITDCNSLWSLDPFKAPTFDAEFADWLKSTEAKIVKKILFEELAILLREKNFGLITVGAIDDESRQVDLALTVFERVLNLSEFKALVSGGERREVEFKSSFLGSSEGQSEVMNQICAMANSGGGTVLVGVGDDGSIKGIEEELSKVGGQDKYRQRCTNIARELLTPNLNDLFQIRFLIVSNVTVLIIAVRDSANEVIYRKDGGKPIICYERTNSGAQKLDAPSVAALALRRVAR